jgi:hypothetical protein
MGTMHCVRLFRHKMLGTGFRLTPDKCNSSGTPIHASFEVLAVGSWGFYCPGI